MLTFNRIETPDQARPIAWQFDIPDGHQLAITKEYEPTTEIDPKTGRLLVDPETGEVLQVVTRSFARIYMTADDEARLKSEVETRSAIER